MGHWALSQEEAQARSCQRQLGERGEVQCTANSSLAPTLHTDRQTGLRETRSPKGSPPLSPGLELCQLALRFRFVQRMKKSSQYQVLDPSFLQ